MIGAGNRNWLFWLGLAIGVAGFCWGASENPSALALLWSGESWEWLAVLAIAAAVAAVAQGFSGRSALFALVLGCVVAIATFGFAPFAIVFLILITGFALGARLLQLAQRKAHEPTSGFIFAKAVVGLSACSLLLGFMAHLPVNVPLTYLALSAASLGWGWRHLQVVWSDLVALSRSNRQGCPQRAWNGLAAFWRSDRQSAAPLPLRIALWFAFGLHVYFAALPERYHDALAMHLVIARALELYDRWHFHAGDYAWAVQPMGANWLFGWAYVLGGEYAAKLLNAVFLLLACGVTVQSRLVSNRLGLFAVAILALTPLAVLESATLFVDNALTMYAVAAIVFAAWIGERRSQAFVVGFAIACAGAIAVKLHGVLVAASVVIALFTLGGWRELYRSGWRVKIICLIALAGAFWPYAYAWYATGNPLFPHFNGVFKSALLPPTNFEISIYPGGLTFSDFFDLTFFSSKYLEGGDGAGGFVVPLLLPTGLFLIAAAGSAQLRLMALTTVIYIVLVLLNIRYIRYLFPVWPLLAVTLVYPLAVVKGRYARAAVWVAAVLAIGMGLGRIPAAGWILSRVDLPTAFSPLAKEALEDRDVPLRKLGRVQALYGDDNSRVVIFGQAAGADIRGWPLYVNWYNIKLQAAVIKMATPEDAASGLAVLDTTHVIFDNRVAKPEWKPWRDAAQKYGRLLMQLPTAELYEFHAGSVPGKDILGASGEAWRGWEMNSSKDIPVAAGNLTLLPGAVVGRAVPLADLPERIRINLSAKHVCEAESTILAQINWLGSDGTVIRTDAARSDCGSVQGTAGMTANRPQGARTAFLYLTNEGGATARLYDERAGALALF